MFAKAWNRFNWRDLRLSRQESLRALAAGLAWGLATSAGLAGLSVWNYGFLCLDDVVMTTATAVVVGILAFGPLAAYGRRRA